MTISFLQFKNDQTEAQKSNEILLDEDCDCLGNLFFNYFVQ